MRKRYRVSITPPKVRSVYGNTIYRMPSTYAKSSGWLSVGNGLHKGSFKTKAGFYQGRIQEYLNGDMVVEIRYPPLDVLSLGSHAACFMVRKNGWYDVHHHGASSVSACILAIENVIDEAWNIHQGHFGIAVDQEGKSLHFGTLFNSILNLR